MINCRRQIFFSFLTAYKPSYLQFTWTETPWLSCLVLFKAFLGSVVLSSSEQSEVNALYVTQLQSKRVYLYPVIPLLDYLLKYIKGSTIIQETVRMRSINISKGAPYKLQFKCNPITGNLNDKVLFQVSHGFVNMQMMEPLIVLHMKKMMKWLH